MSFKVIFSLIMVTLWSINGYKLEDNSYDSDNGLIRGLTTVTKRASNSNHHGGGGSRSRKDEDFLKIQEAPPKPLEAREHGNIILECAASGSPAPRITWFKNGQPVHESYQVNSFNNLGDGSLSETKSKIALNCVNEMDAGLYECVSYNSEMKRVVATEVQVTNYEESECTPRDLIKNTDSPQIVEWMSTYMSLIGSQGRIVCRAESHQKIIWITPSGDVVKTDNKYQLMKNGDLLINNLTFGDMGLFKCIAKNEFGDDFIETFVYPMAGSHTA